MRCAWATLPRRMLRGLRAYQGVNAHVQGLTCEQHATTGTVVPKTQTTSPVTPHFSAFFTEVVCTLGTTELQTATSPPPNGGNGVIRTSTRRRHAGRQLLMLQNPHRHRQGGHRKYPPPCRWVAGPRWTTSQSADRRSRRGRLAGGPPTAQPGPTAGPGAQNTRGSTSNNQRHTATRSVL